MGLSRGTHNFRGVNIRLDQVKVIDPIVFKKENQDGWMGAFMRASKLNMKSQLHFTIWFVGKSGYRDFYSKTKEYVGLENIERDETFIKEYNDLVERWERYHDK